MNKTFLVTVAIFGLLSFPALSAEAPAYEHETTKTLVSLVKNAAALVEVQGEKAFSEFAVTGSKWIHDDSYVFVLDLDGNMLVHPDPKLAGKNQLDLKDIHGKPMIQWFIKEVSTDPNKTEGWSHYLWPKPNSLYPCWKSTFVKLATAPSGKKYIVGSGLYNMKMEKKFVIDEVEDAASLVETKGEAAFKEFRDPSSGFQFMETYIFVIDPNGVEQVNPGFPNLEGKNLMDFHDSEGKYLIREMIELLKTTESGWIDYMWPKPGESISSKKSAFVKRAKFKDSWLVVGSGVYFEKNETTTAPTIAIHAEDLITLVQEAATILEKEGEKAFPEFRKEGSKWLHDDLYFFVWDLSGLRIFHGAHPETEGENVANLKDADGRPIGQMFLKAVSEPEEEGWVHYFYPKPKEIFPTWKSSFLKKVTFPSGKQYLVGCGLYNMKAEKIFLMDKVDKAAHLIQKQGKAAFNTIRDKTGEFIFLGTYTFVCSIDGTELVNPAFPNMEGQNLMNVQDTTGKYVQREIVNSVKDKDRAWVDYMWPKPGETTPSKKQTYLRKVKIGDETFVVGAGAYLE